MASELDLDARISDIRPGWAQTVELRMDCAVNEEINPKEGPI
jgi:hypothetical protein